MAARIGPDRGARRPSGILDAQIFIRGHHSVHPCVASSTWHRPEGLFPQLIGTISPDSRSAGRRAVPRPRCRRVAEHRGRSGFRDVWLIFNGREIQAAARQYAPNCQLLTDAPQSLLPLSARQAREHWGPHSRSEGHGWFSISERYRRRSTPAGSTPGRVRRRCWRPRLPGTRWRANCRPRAASYASTITELGSSWQGPSSAAAASAAAPYTAWLSSTAAQAEQTASQAQAAAAAYEAAFAASIPPPVIAANRALLAAAGRDQLPGPEHPGDRRHRGDLRRVLGPGRGRDVRLRRGRDDRESADPVHAGAGDHQRHRAGHPVGGERPKSARPRRGSTTDRLSAFLPS